MGVLAWYFTNNMQLRDGTPLVEGSTYSLPACKPVVICVSGYHASRRIVDAQHYVCGTELSLVWCTGNILEEKDKLVCRQRTVLRIWKMKDLEALPWFVAANTARAAAWAKATAARDAAWAKADTAWAAAWAKADTAWNSVVTKKLLLMLEK